MSHPLPTLGLARLLNGEQQVSDIIAFLAGLDPEPLRLALGLKVTSLNVVREALVTALQGAKRRSGRVDLLIEGAEGTPLALVEVKIGAGQHGEQYALYETWAAERGLASNCWLVSLCGNEPDAPGTWQTDLTLPQLIGAWRQSTHPHAAWLGGLAADVLERRALQLDGPLGCADDPVVADLLVKRLKVDLERSSVFAHLRAQLWKDMRTKGGAPTLLVWTPMPGHEDSLDVAMCLDLRAGHKNRRPQAWVLRLGVQVDDTDDRTQADARALAHDLAVIAAPHLTRTALTDSLGPDSLHLTEALVPLGRHDGLAGHPPPKELDGWRAAAAAGEAPGRHPMLFHDNGLRLASQLTVDASSLDRHDMLALLEAALVHLSKVAAEIAR